MAKLILGSIKRFGVFEVLSPRIGRIYLTLFEAIVSQDQLRKLELYPIKEGKRGVLVSRQELATLPFIHNLETVINSYLNS